jgi:hypothetical protein
MPSGISPAMRDLIRKKNAEIIEAKAITRRWDFSRYLEICWRALVYEINHDPALQEAQEANIDTE